ncbi:hypothetical protein ABZ348_00695 [Streptomyces sp. NPDC005963]|uniref:phosphorylase family protein n=1 Tax=Streptomyces sp. NPDC005963 TaxID=3156721 RepID=UPI0033F71A91
MTESTASSTPAGTTDDLPGRELAHPGFAACRSAARRVRTTPRGRRAVGALRPRGVAWVIRDRAPLALLLYTAGREGRLVWQGPGGFALLEPPTARTEIWRGPRFGGPWSGLLRWLDTRWSVVVFGLPPSLALLLAILLLPFPALHALVLVIVLIALVYTVGVLLVLVVWQVFFGRTRSIGERADSADLAELWSVRLFHQEQPHRAEELAKETRVRLQRLITAGVRQPVADRGAQVGSVRLATTLAVSRAAVTDAETLAWWERTGRVVPGPDGGHVLWSLGGERPEDLPRFPERPVPFVRFSLVSVIGVVLLLAHLLMGAERDECAPDDCAGAADSYGRALMWTAYQLVWRTAPGVEPVSDAALVLGWTTSALLPTVALVVLAAFGFHTRALAQQRRHRTEGQRQIMGTSRVLVVTVAKVESDAMLDAVESHIGREIEPDFTASIPVFDAGLVGGSRLFIVQAAQGSTNAAGVPAVVGDAIRHLAPHYAVIAGICYGLRPGPQLPGDVLVSEKIHDLDHGKLVETDGGVHERLRGEHVVTSPMLLSAVRAVQRGWSRRSGVRVATGLMLSWGKLLDSPQMVKELVARHPDAIGGDMEGAAFYAAARSAGVESILIKSICDWGANKTDEHQESAARNAADLVLHLILSGALARTPAERRGG